MILAAPLRLAFWSGPRNLSTAMMRSWENRSDTQVMDEPLYAHYLASSGASGHPMTPEILDSQPTSEPEAVASLFAPVLDGVQIDYQKHMAQHLLEEMDRSWLDQQTIVLLLRDPRRVLASYAKVRANATLLDIGLPQQAELADRATVIVDSGNFLRDPEAYLRSICGSVGVAFEQSMLRWPAGPRASDGVWAPAWYGAVERSTGFGPPPEPQSEVSLPPQLEAIAKSAEEIYRPLLDRSLVLPTT